MKKHWVGGLFVVLAGLPFLFRPAAEAPPAGADMETLIIVSPHRRELRDEYSRAFRDYMRNSHGRNAQLSWRDPGGGTGAIIADLRARMAQNAGPGADLFFGGGDVAHIDLRKASFLEPVAVDPEILAGIPPAVANRPIYDPEGHWHGVALASFGIIYHDGLARRLGPGPPVEWSDLTDSRYFGWLASGNPMSSGAVYTCYETVLQAYGYEEGWRILTLMAANTRLFGESASVAPTEVASGDAAAGMAIENYATTAIRNAGDPELRFTLPPGLTQINADPISLLRGAPNPELAIRFIEFCLSPEGQALLIRKPGDQGQLHDQNRYPVREELYADPNAPAANPFAFDPRFQFDPLLDGRRRQVMELMASVWLVDAHPWLAAAWRAVIEYEGAPEKKEDMIRVLTRPPLTEADALNLAGQWEEARAEARRLGRAPAAPDGPREKRRIEDQLARDRMELRRQWGIESLARYEAVRRAAAGR